MGIERNNKYHYQEKPSTSHVNKSRKLISRILKIAAITTPIVLMASGGSDNDAKSLKSGTNDSNQNLSNTINKVKGNNPNLISNEENTGDYSDSDVSLNTDNLFFGSVDFRNNDSEFKTLTFKVMNEYSRMFNQGKITSANDIQQIQEIVNRILSEESNSKDFLGINYIDETNHRSIKSIKISGFSSDEAMKKDFGVGLGEYDEANENLAKIRRDNVINITKKALEKSGFPMEFVTIGEAREMILSPDDLEKISEEAEKNKMSVKELISKYNKSGTLNIEAKKVLDNLIANNRFVSIEVQYEEGVTQVIHVPYGLLIPLLLSLGILKLRNRTRKNDNDYNEEYFGSPEGFPALADLGNYTLDKRQKSKIKSNSFKNNHDVDSYIQKKPLEGHRQSFTKNIPRNANK